MKINGVESSELLTAVVNGLYQKAANPDFNFPIQIKVIDSPEIAKAIFMAPDIFVKNYGFLELLCRGRFSANGADWKIRAAVTQSFFSQSTILLDETTIESIYQKHLQVYLKSSAPNLFQTFINAALEVISRAFGLPKNIPCPADLVNRTRSVLIDQQAIAWFGATPELAEQCLLMSKSLFVEFEALWQSDPDMQKLLNRFTTQAKGHSGFNAVEELLQNVFAATESSSSSLLWTIECMTRHADLPFIISPERHYPEMEIFLDEVLRLFTPVPYVTRVCTQATKIGDVAFAQGEAIVISIVGIHGNPQYWNQPLLFKPKRQEFVDSSYPRHAYIPFISGARACAGMKLARQEVKCGMRALLKTFSVKPSSEARGLNYGLASRPSNSLEPYLVAR